MVLSGRIWDGYFSRHRWNLPPNDLGISIWPEMLWNGYQIGYDRPFLLFLRIKNITAKAPKTTTQGPSTGSERVIRGGGWMSTQSEMRVTKGWNHASQRHADVSLGYFAWPAPTFSLKVIIYSEVVDFFFGQLNGMGGAPLRAMRKNDSSIQ